MPCSSKLRKRRNYFAGSPFIRSIFAKSCGRIMAFSLSKVLHCVSSIDFTVERTYDTSSTVEANTGYCTHDCYHRPLARYACPVDTATSPLFVHTLCKVEDCASMKLIRCFFFFLRCHTRSINPSMAFSLSSPTNSPSATHSY